MTRPASHEYVVVGLGALGSAAAYALALRGRDVLGLERFELGHLRGASHGTSRILRRSYHTPAYVGLASAAFDDWAALEAVSGEQLVTTCGGVDLFPPGGVIPRSDYADSMRSCEVDFETLDAAEMRARWPALAPPDGTIGLYQADTSAVSASLGVATMQHVAMQHGADLHDRAPVIGIDDLGLAGVQVTTPNGRVRCRRLILAADAWTNDLLRHLGTQLPLTVTREQVSYFSPAPDGETAPARLPIWIWMDDPSFYGFPALVAEHLGGGRVKAAQDCGGPVVTADGRNFSPDIDRLAVLEDCVRGLLPTVGPVGETQTCLYTLTPDRDFVLDELPGHPAVLVGLGAGHGFKFAPTFGRVLADLAVDGSTGTDIATFRIERPALSEPGYQPSWLV